MPRLTSDQLTDFLTGGRHLMKIATATPDGWPYVVPVWYHYEGEAFSIAARRQNSWVAYIENDPRVSLCVDTSDAPYTRVLVRGMARIEDMSWFGDWEPWAARYIGQEAAHSYFEETKHIPRVLIRVAPEDIVSWTGGDWHPRYLEDG